MAAAARARTPSATIPYLSAEFSRRETGVEELLVFWSTLTYDEQVDIMTQLRGVRHGDVITVLLGRIIQEWRR